MKFLVPVDGSAHTQRMLEYMGAHPDFFGKGHEYIVMTAVPALSGYITSRLDRETIVDHYQKAAEEALAPVRAVVEQNAWNAKIGYVVGEASASIAGYAETERPDMVVMGSHGHGVLGNLLLGSVATKVLATSKVPVLILR